METASREPQAARSRHIPSVKLSLMTTNGSRTRPSMPSATGNTETPMMERSPTNCARTLERQWVAVLPPPDAVRAQCAICRRACVASLFSCALGPLAASVSREAERGKGQGAAV